MILKFYGGASILDKDKSILSYTLGFVILLFAGFYIGGINNNVDMRQIVLVYLFTVGSILIVLGIIIEKPIEKTLIFLGEGVMALIVLIAGAFNFIGISYIFGGLVAIVGTVFVSWIYYSKKDYNMEKK